MTRREYRPTLAQLRTFATVAEFGHFGTAANQLHISQPSLSQALSALEQGLGVQLIERSTRRVFVTPVGRKLLPYAQKVLENVSEFISLAQDSDSEFSGHLSVGLAPSIAPSLLPGLVQAAQDEGINEGLSFSEDRSDNLIDSLRHGRMDLAVVGSAADIEGLELTKSFDEVLVLVIPADHKLAGARQVPVEKLKDANTILLYGGDCLRESVVRLSPHITEAGEHHSISQATSLETLCRLVASGTGATVIPISAIPTVAHIDNLGFGTFAASAQAHRRVGIAYRSSPVRAEQASLMSDFVYRAFRSQELQAKRLLKLK